KSSCPIARICTDCVLLAPCQTQPKSAQCEGHQKLPNCHKVRNRKQRCEIESYPPETLKFCGYLRMAYRAGGWHVWLIRRSCAEFSPSAQLSRPSRGCLKRTGCLRAVVRHLSPRCSTLTRLPNSREDLVEDT